MATWGDEMCPLEGRCVECGLDFEWVDVLRGHELSPMWCVEFARWWRLPRSVAGTWWRALLPRRFYHALRMTDGIRPGRLLLYLACIAAMLYAALSVTAGVLAYRDLQGWNFIGLPPPRARDVVVHAMLQPLSGSSRTTAPRELLEDVSTPIACVVATATYAALLPIGMLVLPVTMRRARVLPQHLLRIGAYNASWLPVAAAAGILLIVGEIYVLAWASWIAAVSTLSILIVLTAAWYLALRHYLRLPTAPAVATATIVMAGLASLVAFSSIGFDALSDLIYRMMS